MQFDTVIHGGLIATADYTAKGDIGIKDGLGLARRRRSSLKELEW